MWPSSLNKPFSNQLPLIDLRFQIICSYYLIDNILAKTYKDISVTIGYVLQALHF